MDKVTRQCPQTTTFLKRKESRSGIEPRSFCLPAKPAHKALSVTLVTVYVTECTVCVPDHDPLTFLFLSSFLFHTLEKAGQEADGIRRRNLKRKKKIALRNDHTKHQIPPFFFC